MAAKGRPTGFARQWRDELPRVAASLTTALVLFLASLSFAPVRQWLFGQEVRTYPLSCTADPVAAAPGKRVVEFYIFNRSREDYSGEALQQALNAALQGTGGKASAAIVLDYDGVGGRIEDAGSDAAFNEGKGELDVRRESQRVQIAVRQIDSGALLRVNIRLADMPDVGSVPRDAKVLVPFEIEEIQEACYTRA